MVGGDQQFASEAEGFLDDRFDARVDGFDGLDRGFDDTGVTDHVGVGEVQNHKIVVLEF